MDLKSDDKAVFQIVDFYSIVDMAGSQKEIW
jgi:hypothetical protein